MAKIIEAVARITAEDKTGAVFDKIAKKIEGIAKTAKSSVAVEKFSKALETAQKQMAAIDKFGAARGGFADARLRFREAEMAVQRAAAAMKRGEGDAVALQRGYEKAQKAASNASAAFERQKSALLANKRALDEMGIPASRAVEHQNRLRMAVERTNAALERQPGRLSRAASATARGIGNIAPFAGPAILRGTKEAVKSGAEIQSEIVKMRAAGIPEGDIQRAVAQSAELGSKYTNVKRSTSLERFKELRSVLLHPEEAHELLPVTVQANAAMNALDTSGHLSEGLGFGIKGAEILGRAQDPKRFREYLDSFIKAQQVMGKTITPEQQFEMAKYFGASGATLSDRFVNTTGISLAQEMQSKAAVGTDQLIKQVVGGFQGSQHAAAKEFVALGLADKDDFETTKTGAIKGLKPGRHVRGSKVAQSDPDKYIYDYVLPAMEKAGITDQKDQIAEVRRLFPSGKAADVVAKLITQRPSFENHAKLYGEAQGLNAIDNNQSDPFVALNSFKTSLENFAGTLTSPAMQSAAGVLSSMASSLGSWSEALAGWQKNNPELAKYAGGTAAALGFGGGAVLTGMLGYNFMTGFGLPAASVSLNTSAAALSAAAAELSGAAAIGKGVTAATSAAGTGIWAAGAAALPFVAGAAGVAGGIYAMHKSVEDAGYTGMTSGERLRMQRGSMRDVYRRAFGYGEFGGPEVSPTMTYGTGVGGDKSLNVSVSGDLKGQGEVTIKIEAGSTLIQVVEQAKAALKLAGTINSNGPGSLGHSSPDAAAPARSTGGASGDW